MAAGLCEDTGSADEDANDKIRLECDSVCRIIKGCGIVAVVSGTLALAVPVDAETVGPDTTCAASCTASSSCGSSTGHKLHTERSASQYTSTSKRGNPTPRRFEKHFRKALCSNWLFTKQACVRETAARVWKSIGTRNPTSRCACRTLITLVRHQNCYRYAAHSESFAPRLDPACIDSILVWVVKVFI